MELRADPRVGRRAINTVAASLLMCGCRNISGEATAEPDTSNSLNRLRSRLYSSDQNDQLVQSHAARQLARSSGGLAILLTAAKDKDDEIRSVSAIGLATSQEAAAQKMLLELLKDPSPPVRTTTLANLFGNKAPEIVSAVEDCLKSNEPIERSTAIGTLSGDGGPETLKAISALSNDPSLDVRRTYYRVLHRYGKDGIPYLQKGAKDPSPEIAALSKSELDAMLHPNTK